VQDEPHWPLRTASFIRAGRSGRASPSRARQPVWDVTNRKSETPHGRAGGDGKILLRRSRSETMRAFLLTSPRSGRTSSRASAGVVVGGLGRWLDARSPALQAPQMQFGQSLRASGGVEEIAQGRSSNEGEACGERLRRGRAATFFCAAAGRPEKKAWFSRAGWRKADRLTARPAPHRTRAGGGVRGGAVNFSSARHRAAGKKGDGLSENTLIVCGRSHRNWNTIAGFGGRRFIRYTLTARHGQSTNNLLRRPRVQSVG